MKIKFKIVFILMIVITFVVTSFPVYATQETTTIKVGYTLNYGTVISSTVNNQKGYGYDYLTKIFDYVGDEYELEFICCEWSDAMDMLTTGEIDILGPITKTDVGMESYLYTASDFGDNVILLSTLTSNEYQYANYDDINDSVIAVQNNNPNEYLLYEFLDEYDLEANIVYFDDNDYEKVMQENDYDFCLCSSLQTMDSLSPVAKLGTTSFYYVTDINNTELMNLIDDGMAEIEQKEYLFQEKLFLEYYDYSLLSANYVTNEEYALLQEKEMYYIGVENFDSPICYKDENGDFQGISIDALSLIMDQADVPYTIVEITQETSSEEYDNLDFYLLANDESLGMIASDTYYSLSMVLIEPFSNENAEFNTIGTVDYLGIDETNLPYECVGETVLTFTNVTDMINSYNDGEIDSFILTSASLNLFRNEIDSLDFINTTIDKKLGLVLMFPEDYSDDLIDIFNKVIGQIDSTQLDTSLLFHSTEESNDTLLDYLEDNPWVANIAILSILLFIALSEYGRRKTLKKVLEYDELTGLYSKHKFIKEAKKILAKGENNLYTIVTIDIDNFKYINELYGYETGSKVIQILGKCIKEDAGHALLFARHEADKFILLLRNDDENHELSFTLKNNDKLMKMFHPYIGDTYTITFSIGAYLIENTEDNLDFMIDCANIARNLGKEAVDATIHVFSKEMDVHRIKINEIVASMKQAIVNEEFILQYQPKVDMNSRVIVGGEALVRWKKGGDLIPPNDFISIFEKNGFIETLDYYVLSKTCEFIKSNPFVPKISVNISAVTIIKKQAVKNIMDTIDNYAIPYYKIDIEITETAFMENMKEIFDNVQQLRDKGISISIDDFGVGTSSLSRLKDMSVDTLKIDREFIIDCIENDRGKKIINSVILLAKSLDLEVVAEGVETKSQEEFLASLGCDIGQGYYYSRPVDGEEFIKQLEKTAE